MNNLMNVQIDPSIHGILPHEINTALALGKAGYKVTFVKPRNGLKTADAYVNGVLFEFKSSEGSKSRTIEHVIKKAAKQSCNLVFDSCRMKNMRDRSIQSYLVKYLQTNRMGIKRILFVNRNREVIDINKLI